LIAVVHCEELIVFVSVRVEEAHQAPDFFEQQPVALVWLCLVAIQHKALNLLLVSLEVVVHRLALLIREVFELGVLDGPQQLLNAFVEVRFFFSEPRRQLDDLLLVVTQHLSVCFFSAEVSALVQAHRGPVLLGCRLLLLGA
jgi:hypothetical protein